MKRWLIRLLIMIALVLYSLLVYSWWTEGNENFERQRRETCAEHRTDGTPYDKLPQGCRDLVQ